MVDLRLIVAPVAKPTGTAASCQRCLFVLHLLEQGGQEREYLSAGSATASGGQRGFSGFAVGGAECFYIFDFLLFVD